MIFALACLCFVIGFAIGQTTDRAQAFKTGWDEGFNRGVTEAYKRMRG